MRGVGGGAIPKSPYVRRRAQLDDATYCGASNRGVAYDKAAFVPHFFADTCAASARTETPRGEISISWSKTSTEYVADVVVPRGTEATLELFDESRAVSTGRIVIKL